MVIGCIPKAPAATSTVRNPTQTLPEPTPTLQGKTLIVTSADDDGSGTLRQALQKANAGDTVIFDTLAFPPDNPKVIHLESTLPRLVQGNVTVDASNAGVIIEGSKISNGWNSAIQLLSNGNIIRGFQIANFSGAAIQISGGQNNHIENNVIYSNDFSIGLWGTMTSGNEIKGNFLGVLPDKTTSQGNKSAGIVIMEGAHNNLIGPDNCIAFNARYGIEIRNANTTGNTIFRNSIYDNGIYGISLTQGGNEYLTAPILLDFDLVAGSVNGVACPNCEVLMYSDAKNEGRTFEGQTVADDQGTFSFEKGSAFSGPTITATATDSQGNTSAFSLPPAFNSRIMQLQLDNIQPRVLLMAKTSDELEDNHLGGLFTDFWQPMDFQQIINGEIVPMGLKHINITINEGEYFSNTEHPLSIDWSKPEMSIPPEFDDYITQLVSHNITIHYVLIFWDKANHPNGWEVQSRFKTEEEITRYLEYVRFIVSNFKGRVRYYELWNEPDNAAPLQYIAPIDYINLAKRTIPVIKEIDPEAKIIVGGISGMMHPSAREYLFKILNSDIMLLADGVSWHPLFGNIPNSGQYPDYYTSYPSLLEKIISTAKQNGFQGEFIASEIGYRGPRCGGCDINDPSFSDIVSAKYAARGLILHFSNHVMAGAGGISSERPVHFNTMRNIANVFAGVSAEDFAVRVQTEAKNLIVFTFTKTDRSKLIALWTDGVAVDEDSGVPSTLTIPGFAGWNATGIDTLNGFEQKLVISSENGNLIIRDLLIKDYPIVIQLSK